MRISLGSRKEIYGKTYSTPHLKKIRAVANVATYFRNGLCVTNWGCLPRSPGGGSKIRPNFRSLQFQVKRAADPAPRPSRMHPRRIRRHHFWKRNFNCSFPKWNNGYDQDRRRGRERIVNLHVKDKGSDDFGNVQTFNLNWSCSCSISAKWAQDYFFKCP